MTDITYLQNPTEFPALDEVLFEIPSVARLATHERSRHKPRFLMLYGSVRERSYSRLLTFEAARLLEAMGGEVKVFNPTGSPLPDDAPDTHPQVKERRELVRWAEGMVRTTPQRGGAMTGIMKAQSGWVPWGLGAGRPTQGKTLAVRQVSGGSQAFNAVSQMRVLGRWMRVVTIP